MATLSKWLLQLHWFPSTGNGTFQDTSWLELMWFFVWSTNCSVPVLVEGKYVTRGESTDFVLVEPTTVQLLKTFRYFIIPYRGEISKRLCSTCQSQNHCFDRETELVAAHTRFDKQAMS